MEVPASRIAIFMCLVIAVLSLPALSSGGLTIPWGVGETEIALRCISVETIPSPGARLRVNGELPVAEVSRADPFYVSHGWGGTTMPPCIVDADEMERFGFVAAHTVFELRIDGRLDQPCLDADGLSLDVRVSQRDVPPRSVRVRRAMDSQGHPGRLLNGTGERRGRHAHIVAHGDYPIA